MKISVAKEKNLWEIPHQIVYAAQLAEGVDLFLLRAPIHP